MNRLINDRYSLIKKIGKGSFGEVYLGEDTLKNAPVAIKMELMERKHVLAHEYDIYKNLSQSGLNIPEIYWYGNYNNKYRVIVMKQLGASVESLLQHKCHGKFSLKTTLMLAVQMFDQIKLLHDNHFIHRDLKPENFLMGTGPKQHLLYLIDFGLAKRFKSPERVHIKEIDDKKLIGTARYASINAHKGIELSRRDDLESLLYLIIYFLKGQLPWQGLLITNIEERYIKIGEYKASILPEKLCEGLPVELVYFLKYTKSLAFKEKPKYQYLRSLLVKAFNNMGYKYDYRYDWTLSDDGAAGLESWAKI